MTTFALGVGLLIAHFWLVAAASHLVALLIWFVTPKTMKAIYE